MNSFMNDDFLLHNKTAVYLYHEIAAEMPIFDFHSHLSPMDIYEDQPYENLYQLWLAHDHYKWRAMRAGGICEDMITGEGLPYDKFLAWSSIVPDLIGNPLYHWTHLELQRYFGIHETLNMDTADAIWTKANQVIHEKALSPRKLLKQMNVLALCTTDDITQNLDGHRLLQEDPALECAVYPTFRLDPLFCIDLPEFISYIKALEAEVNCFLPTFDSLLQALTVKLDEYGLYRCHTSDHGLPYVPFRPMSGDQVDAIFKKRLAGGIVTIEEMEGFQTALLLFLFPEYKKRSMVAQIHIGSLRNGNSAMNKSFGSAAGCDSMHDTPVATQLNQFFDKLNSLDMLPRVILFTVNPAMNYPLATISGNFCNGEIPGKVQLGTAWWLMDHKDGIEEQLKVYANCGLLPSSVGMLTDSRSFLSYPRHEYYRRILCNLIGSWVEAGEYPDKMDFLIPIVKNICYNNAHRFFSLSDQTCSAGLTSL